MYQPAKLPKLMILEPILAESPPKLEKEDVEEGGGADETREGT